MFKAAAPNPYDELVVKATHEDLLSEDWDTNLTICDKVQAEGEGGAKNVITALLKRLSHRNPNVQIFALELANSLFQNCTKPLHLELSSRAWTGAMDRLITDRTTVPQVKTKAIGYVKSWWEGLKGSDAEGVMGELIESLKAKNVPLAVPAKQSSEDEASRRAREEEAEIARAIEISKQDQGGRNGPHSQPSHSGPSGSGSSYPVPSGSGSGSGPSRDQIPYQQSVPYRQPAHDAQTNSNANAPKPFIAREPTPPPMPTRSTASRVRAIYPFVTHEKGELSFEKGDVIKVIDRMYDEWYTGAVGGKIGIFPISYVEPLPDPTVDELQREAQDEAKVFAAQGMIVNLQRMLDGLDPSRGDRVDDPELEDMYQKVVTLQPQIVSLMKKYADQRAELEHIHMGFVKASRQYAVMTQQPGPLAVHPGYVRHPSQDPYAAQHPAQYSQQVQEGQHHPQGYGPQQGQVGGNVDPATQQAQEQHAAAWAAYYAQVAAQQQQQQQQQMAGSTGQVHSETTNPQGRQELQAQAQSQAQVQAQAQPVQSQAEREKIAAAWEAYYAAQAAQMQAAQIAQAGQVNGPGSGGAPSVGQAQGYVQGQGQGQAGGVGQHQQQATLDARGSQGAHNYGQHPAVSQQAFGGDPQVRVIQEASAPYQHGEQQPQPQQQPYNQQQQPYHQQPQSGSGSSAHQHPAMQPQYSGQSQQPVTSQYQGQAQVSLLPSSSQPQSIPTYSVPQHPQPPTQGSGSSSHYQIPRSPDLCNGGNTMHRPIEYGGLEGEDNLPNPCVAQSTASAPVSGTGYTSSPYSLAESPQPIPKSPPPVAPKPSSLSTNPHNASASANVIIPSAPVFQPSSPGYQPGSLPSTGAGHLDRQDRSGGQVQVGSMPGLERAISNLSVGSQRAPPPPMEARFT